MNSIIKIINKMLVLALAILPGLLLQTRPAWSQMSVESQVNSIYTYLANLQPGGRHIGLGSTFLSATDIMGATFFNPARIGSLQGFRIGISGIDQSSEDVRYGTVALARAPFTVGVSYFDNAISGKHSLQVQWVL